MKKGINRKGARRLLNNMLDFLNSSMKRLIKLGLNTPEMRRLRGDLIKVSDI